MNRLALSFLPLSFLIMLAAAGAFAQSSYPEKPVRLVVPFPPGGTVDLVARLIAERLGPGLGQPVVVDNRAGAGGAIGAESVARAAPDGYALLLGTGSTHGTNPAVNKKLPYDPVKDFTPIVMLARTPYILVAHPAVPAQSVREFVALARAQPGKINFASYGPGSSNHLASELFKAMAGIDLVHVPYKGAAPAVTAIVAGEVQVMFDVVGTSGPHIKTGKLKLLGVGSPRRSSLAPESPTLAESGIAGFDAGTFFALFAPAGTPRPIVDRLNREGLKVLAMTEVGERLVAMGNEIAGGPSEALGEAVSQEVAKWQRLVRERNLVFD
ncbi:MAG: Bug family tripartite tricarboxylate transporter substrate binding protein [Burkholderiales bacterium]